MVNDELLEIQVKIQPNSSRNQIVGLQEGRLKIKIAAPPVDGKANERLISVIAKTFNVPKSGIEIVKGKSSKLKTLRVSGLSQERYDAFLCGYD